MAVQEHYIWCPADGRCGCALDVAGLDADRLRERAELAAASTPIWAAVLADAARRLDAARKPVRKRAAPRRPRPAKSAPVKPIQPDRP